MVSAGDFKNGITLEMDGNIWQIIEFQHVKPGKGAAFVRTKLKNIKSGGVIEKSFRPTEKFPLAHIDKSEYQYLYSDGDFYVFMNTETFEQINLTKDNVGDALKFVKENDICKLSAHQGQIFAVEPPMFVELEITETEPGVKGDTATGATKPANVETGAQVMVPLFVNLGDKIKNEIGSGVVLVVSAIGSDKVNMIAMATDDAVAKGAHAGNLIKAVASLVGGGGGGRPNMAQAGGKNPAGIPELLKKAPNVLEEQL